MSPPPRRASLLLLLMITTSFANEAAEVPQRVSANGCGGSAAWRVAAAAAVRALESGGVPAQLVPKAEGEPAKCAEGGLPRDSPYCLSRMIYILSQKQEVEVCAVVGFETAGCLPDRLKDFSVTDLGDTGPATRRVCLASLLQTAPAPKPHSLRDLSDNATARLYALSKQKEKFVRTQAEWRLKNCNNKTSDKICPTVIFTPPQCNVTGDQCGWMLVEDAGELAVMRKVVEEEKLLVHIAALGSRLSSVLKSLHDDRLLVCTWQDEMDTLPLLNVTVLDTPPCNLTARAHCNIGGRPPDLEPCPFEARRVAKLVYSSQLARIPLLARVMRRLTADWKKEGEEVLARRWSEPEPPRELHVAVLLSASGERAARDMAGLQGAALLAGEGGMDQCGAWLSVKLRDDRCSTRHTLQLVMDVVRDEFQVLSAVAGPEGGAALREARALSAVFRLPVLAFTPGVGGRGAGGSALLAGGDAADRWKAVGEVLIAHKWRRIALLTDGSLPLMDTPLRPDLNLALSETLPEEDRDHDHNYIDLIYKWGQRVEEQDLRILVVSVESAAALAASVCAARGRTGGAGRVILMPREPPPGWLDTPVPPGAPDTNCSLRTAAAGVLAVRPDWAHDWKPSEEWLNEWKRKCLDKLSNLEEPVTSCERPTPRAALLYDTLRLWVDAVERLRDRSKNRSVDDIHDPEVIRSLMQYATNPSNQSALKLQTGPFEWNIVSQGGEVVATRREALLVTQLDGEGAGEGGLRVARWHSGHYQTLNEPHWNTIDGLAPRDAPPCTLQALADLLGTECSTALAALLGALLSLVMAGTVFIRCRLKRHYSERLKRELKQLTDGGGGSGGSAGSLHAARWEISRKNVVINRKIGVGAFGTVYGGNALLPDGGSEAWTAVAVKMLRPRATLEEKLDFLSEAEMMKRFDHKNIVRLLCVITASEPVCVVIELQMYGDLKNYLLSRRHLAFAHRPRHVVDPELEADAEAEAVTPRRLTSLALDGARALSYLAEQRYVHCDVAARNCLISSSRQLKLADFGMTRSVHDTDYYQVMRQRRLPVRWMAPESVEHRVFSHASDIWSYGVLLYEIVTFGAEPYRGLCNHDAERLLVTGGTPTIPPGIKPQLQGLMKSCWSMKAEARPAAHEVVTFLADAPALLTASLDVLREGGGGVRQDAGADPEGYGGGTDHTYVSDTPPDLEHELVTLLA